MGEPVRLASGGQAGPPGERACRGSPGLCVLGPGGGVDPHRASFVCSSVPLTFTSKHTFRGESTGTFQPAGGEHRTARGPPPHLCVCRSPAPEASTGPAPRPSAGGGGNFVERQPAPDPSSMKGIPETAARCPPPPGREGGRPLGLGAPLPSARRGGSVAEGKARLAQHEPLAELDLRTCL